MQRETPPKVDRALEPLQLRLKTQNATEQRQQYDVAQDCAHNVTLTLHLRLISIFPQSKGLSVGLDVEPAWTRAASTRGPVQAGLPLPGRADVSEVTTLSN